MPIALRTKKLSKNFRLFKERPESLKQMILGFQRTHYEIVPAVRDVDLEISTGVTMGIVGRNGSGKSTLLRLIAGIYRPSSGSVTVSGRVAALLELGTGFHPELSGRDNVMLNGAIMGLSRQEIEAVFADIVAFSGIADFIDAPIKTYSTGMYVRLAFAVAVHVHPSLLLIDEVLAVGDAEFQQKCIRHVRHLQDEGTTIVLVSHQLKLLKEMCQKCVWMESGRVRDAGTSSEVIEAYSRESLQSVPTLTASQPGSLKDLTMSNTEQVQIIGLELLAEDGSRMGRALTGMPIRIRIRYRAKSEGTAAFFALAFRASEGSLVGEIEARSKKPAWLEGEGYGEYFVDRLSLQPGSYDVVATIVGSSGARNIRTQKELTIMVDRPAGSTGMDLHGQWTFGRR